MLHEFVASERDAILARMREKLADRGGPSSPPSDAGEGVSAFLTQLSATLRSEATAFLSNFSNQVSAPICLNPLSELLVVSYFQTHLVYVLSTELK